MKKVFSYGFALLLVAGFLYAATYGLPALDVDDYDWLARRIVLKRDAELAEKCAPLADPKLSLLDSLDACDEIVPCFDSVGPERQKTILRELETLAANNNPRAQYYMGYYLALAEGEGEAKPYFQKAARRGMASAKAAYGRLLVQEGKHEKGLALLEEAADMDPRLRGSYVVTLCSESGLHDAQETASPCHRELVDLARGGNPVAIAEVFKLSKEDPEFQEELRWFRERAEAGYGEYFPVAGAMYLFGAGVDRDYARAEYWLGRSMADGSLAGAKLMYILRSMKEETGS